MNLSIRINKMIVRINVFLNNPGMYWEKYLLTNDIEINEIIIKKRDYYFTTKQIKENLQCI
jgi:hypothetical protein